MSVRHKKKKTFWMLSFSFMELWIDTWFFYDVDWKRCRIYHWWYWSVICSFLFSLRFIQFIEISLFRFPFYLSWHVFFVYVIIWLGIVTNKFFLIILKIISLILSIPLSLIILSTFFNEMILKILSFCKICCLILKNMFSEFVRIISSCVSMTFANNYKT